MAILRRFRLTEFQLLVVPSLLAVLGQLIVFLVPIGDVAFTWRDIWVSLAFVALLYGMHLWFSAMGFRGDQTLLPLVATLAGLGLVMIMRLQPALARREPALANLAPRQIAFMALGFLLMWAMVAIFRRHHLSLLRRYKYTWAVLAILLAAATMVFGVERNGARLWFSVFGFSFQPSEILKIVLVIFLAAYLDDKRELLMSPYRVGPLRLPPLPYLLPMLLMWGASLLVLIVAEGPRQRAALLRHLPEHALCRQRPVALRRRRAGRLHRRRGRRLPDLRPCARARRDLAQPLGRPARQRLPDHPGDLRAGDRRPLRHAAWRWAARPGSRRSIPTSSSRPSARSWG